MPGSSGRVGRRAVLLCSAWIGCNSGGEHADGGGSHGGTEESTSIAETGGTGSDDPSSADTGDGSCATHEACAPGTYCEVGVGCVEASPVEMCQGAAHLALYDNVLPQMSSPTVLETVFGDGIGSEDLAGAFGDVLAVVGSSGIYVAQLSGPVVAITSARTGGRLGSDVVAVTENTTGYEIHRWDWSAMPPAERSVRMLDGAVPWSISPTSFFGVEDLVLASSDGLVVLPDDGSDAVTITAEPVESAFAAGLLDALGDEVVGHVGGVSTYWRYDGTMFHATAFADTAPAERRALTWANGGDDRPVIGVTPQSGGALLFTWESDGVSFAAPQIEALPLPVDRIVAGHIDGDELPDLAVWMTGGDTVLVRLSSVGCYESHAFDDVVTSVAAPPGTSDLGSALLVGHGPGIERFRAID